MSFEGSAIPELAVVHGNRRLERAGDDHRRRDREKVEETERRFLIECHPDPDYQIHGCREEKVDEKIAETLDRLDIAQQFRLDRAAVLLLDHDE